MRVLGLGFATSVRRGRSGWVCRREACKLGGNESVGVGAVVVVVGDDVVVVDAEGVAGGDGAHGLVQVWE